MLSALIPSIHSYPAVHLVAKPVDQRYVQPSPLVLGPTPLKCKRLQQIETNLSHAIHYLVITDALDYTTLRFLIGESTYYGSTFHPAISLAKSLRGFS